MRNKLDARHDFLRRFGVPENWKPITLGEVADVMGGGTPSRDEGRFWKGGEIPWLTPTDLTANQSKYISKSAESITDVGLASSGAILLPAGAVLYTSRATIGAKAIAEVPVATNQGFASFVPREIDGEYLYYLLEFLTPVIKRLAAGTTFDEVSKRDIRTVYFSIPALSVEQAAIARILDTVDRAIEWEREAANRAKAVKQALVQEVFCQGIRTEPQKKTSIGFIPQSWDVRPVNAVVTNFEYGLSLPMHLKGATPILRMGNIQHGDVLMDDLKYVTLSPKLLDRYLLMRGDVLFNRTNSQAHVGKVGIYRLEQLLA